MSSIPDWSNVYDDTRSSFGWHFVGRETRRDEPYRVESRTNVSDQDPATPDERDDGKATRQISTAPFGDRNLNSA